MKASGDGVTMKRCDLWVAAGIAIVVAAGAVLAWCPGIAALWA
jgi:hypothetical protein